MKMEIKQKEVKQTPSKSRTFVPPSQLIRTLDGFNSRTHSQVLPNQNNNLNSSKSHLKCGIDNKYLKSINYSATCEFAKKRNALYKQHCSTIRDYYIEFNYLYESCSQKVSPLMQKHGKHIFLTQFTTFVNEFMLIFREVSIVQVGYFQNLEEDFARRQYSLEWSTNQFIEKLRIYKNSQFQFQARAVTRQKQLQQIYLLYQNLKKDEKDPYSFFNRKQSAKKVNELLQSLHKQQTTRELLRKDLNEVYENSTQFEGNLILYRQLLFTNKYKIMKKLSEISRNSRNSLMEFLAYLFDCTSRKSEQFIKIMKKSASSTLKKKSFSNTDDKLAVESFLVEVTNQYNRTIGQIETVVKTVAEVFQQLRKFNSIQIQKKKNILELMNAVYDVDQNPENQVSKTLNFYQDFCTKISEINNGINIATNEYAKLKKQANKLTEITLSLLRNSKNSIFQKSLEGSLHHEGGHHSQIQILLEKLSYDYPITLLQNIYKDFQKNLSYLKNDASQKFHIKKRIMMDSMQISQFEDETLVQPKKRICKRQNWLWEKWQNQNDFKIDEFKISSLSQIRQFTAKFTFQEPQAKQMDRFSCSLQTKGETAGFLIITDKYLKFQNSQGNYILTILLQEIEDVKIVVKMFGKLVAIATMNGIVYLRGCMDIQRILDTIEEARSSSGAPISKPPRSVIQVTVQELAFMQERKSKIQDQLPKIQDYTYESEILIENISIDHLYELIYSDKEVNIRGKTEPNFFAYVMKKSGSTNYECTKYDSIGPKFFTHEQGVTFINCPVFSTRIMNYDVKLPPVPFMPTYAHNREECKFFWISNQEFIYLIHNNASGAPKADTFFLQILHKVQKVDEKAIRILFYWRIVFTEDSFLKSTIQGSASEESKRGIKITLTEVRKYCRQMTNASSDGNKGSGQNLQKDVQDNQQQQTRSGQVGFVGKLVQSVGQMVNKFLKKGGKEKIDDERTQSTKQDSSLNTNVLLIVLTVVLVLNLVFHLFRSKQ